MNIEKGKTSNGYATRIQLLYNSRPVAEGGYCAFMENIIIKMIITKIAAISFFAISTMLTFHKHPSFHRLSIVACEYKSRGIALAFTQIKDLEHCCIGTVFRIFNSDSTLNRR